MGLTSPNWEQFRDCLSGLATCIDTSLDNLIEFFYFARELARSRKYVIPIFLDDSILPRTRIAPFRLCSEIGSSAVLGDFVSPFPHSKTR